MLVCIVLLIGLVTLFACNKSDVADNDGQTKVIVKIQNEDGSIYKENVVFSDLFTLSLQKEGYTGRLYRDADFLKPLTKDSKVKNGDTVYVKWTINSYTVTFMDGKTVLKTEKVQHGSAVTAPEVPEKDGKTFKGWDNKAYNNVTSDLTINAVYDVDTFTVTFKDGEKVLETQTVEYDKPATAPTVTPAPGKKHTGWDVKFDHVKEDLVVNATFEDIIYTVKFVAERITIREEKVTYGGKVAAPDAPEVTGKTFERWNGTAEYVTENVTITAIYRLNSYTIKFILNNGEGDVVRTQDYGTAITAPTPEMTGYTFKGWDKTVPETMPAKDVTITAQWKINKYTITFVLGNGEENVVSKHDYGTAITAPGSPVREGYTFDGWDKTVPEAVPAEDVTITAKWTVNQYTVTFVLGNGKENVVLTQDYGTAITVPTPKKVGYTFVGWDKTVPETMPANDVTITAKWKINKYTITCVLGNGKDDVVHTQNYGTAITAPTPEDTAEQSFVGWDKSVPETMPAENLTFTAQWETRKYKLTFIDQNGDEIYGKALEWGESIKVHFDKADTAVTFDEDILEYVGWYDQSDSEKTIIGDFSGLKMPTRDLTYVLKLSLTASAIGDFTVVKPENFTFTENNSAKFTVNGTPYKGVTYKYIWTINKDNVIYKTEKTTESSLTLQNLAAGEYLANVKIVASVEGCGSVEKSIAAAGTLTVKRANISGIKVTGVTMTYGDKNAKIGISGLREGDVVTYGTDGTTFPLQNVDLSELDCADEYGYYVRIDRGDNYYPYTSKKVTVTINQAKVTATVTPDDDSLYYGDNLPSLTAKIGEENYTIESGNYELHLGYNAIKGSVANNVGTYNIENVDISVLFANYPDNNYEIKVVPKGTITIKEAPLTVTIDEIAPLTYGNKLPEITYSFEGLKLSDKKEDFTVTINTGYKEKSPVGDGYKTTTEVTGSKVGFYDISVNEISFKVVKREATITVNKVDDIVYGSEEPPKLEATVDGVLDGELVYSLTTTYTDKALVGTCEVNVSVDEVADVNKNYDVKVAYTNKTFQVTPRDLTIKLNKTPTVAIGKTYTVEAEHLEKIGLVAGDTVTGHVTITKDVAGPYNADAFDKSNLGVTNADCYVISYEMSVTFVEVGDFAIDFTTKPVTYDGQPHGVLVTAKEGTNYTITYGTTENDCTLTSSPEYTNAGAYTIYFKVVDNVTLAEHVGYVTLTISPAEVTVKVDDVTITYGEKPAFSHTVAGLVDGETLSGEAVYSGAGTDAGDYVISVSGLTASNNYNVSFVKGKLTINKKSATVTWTNAGNRDYSPDGQTLPTATYDGKTANLKFTKGGTVCDFKDAGEYKVTVADDNYILTNNEKAIVINKTKYTSVTAHEALSGTYDPNKTLGNYALSAGFTWADPDEVPVCTKTEYAAKYNMDTANYEDYETTLTLVLQKAMVTLAQDLFEFNYDGASHEIRPSVMYGTIKLDESLYNLTYKKEFSDAGTHRTLVTMDAANYDLPKDTYVYVKVRGVKVGNNYYTIEDALDVAASGQTIFVLNDTAFATQEIAGVLYNDVKFKTVKTGVTLLLPFNENDTVGHIGAGEDGSANYKATAALTGTAKLYKTLVIPEGVEVIVNGKLVVGAQTGKIDAGTNQNAVSGNYCEISLGGTITLNNATLEVYGYIKGNGEISANNTTVIENLYLSGWLGGSESAARYVGNREIGVGEALGNELKIDTPNMFPFSQYELRAIQSRVIINKGSKLQGYTKIATGEIDIKIAKIKAQINEAVLTFISSDASNASSGLFRLVGNNSKIVKSMSGDRVRFDLYGEVNDGYTSISIKVVKATVKMASEKVFFPIDGRTDITLKNGATFTQSYMFKALPGATITVESGGIYNLNGKLVMYDRSFTEKGYPGAARGDAKLIVNGTMNVNGALGGNVTSDNAGTVAIGANATITNIKSIEGNGSLTIDKGMLINAKVILHFTESGSVTKSLVFVNADNSTVAAVTNKTYNYNNGTWL